MCRVCGKLILSEKQKKNYVKPFPCERIRNDLFMVCRLDIATDKEHKHSRFVCFTCSKAIPLANKRQSRTSINRLEKLASDNDHIWSEYLDTNDIASCSVCSHRETLSRGCLNSPFSRKKVIQSKSDTDLRQSNIITNITDNSFASPTTETIIPKARH